MGYDRNLLVESIQNRLQNEVSFCVLLSLCILYNVMTITVFVCTGNCGILFTFGQ
jgi:hypothetical protein